MFLLIDVPSAMKKFYQFAFGIGNDHLYELHAVCQNLGNLLTQSIQSSMLERRHGYGIGIETDIKFLGVIQQINFVKGSYTRLLTGIQVMENIIDRFTLLDSIFVADVDDFQEEVSIDDLLKSSTKSSYELRRQFLNKANGISEKNFLVTRQHFVASNRIERSKELVLSQHICLRKGIKKSRFASVGVANHSYNWNGLSSTLLAMNETLLAYTFNIFAQFCDTSPNTPAIDF